MIHLSRRDFLQAGGLATLGLLLGAEALEAFQRLTYRRKYVQGWNGPVSELTTARLMDMWGRLACYETPGKRVYWLANSAVTPADIGKLYEKFGRPA